VLIWLFTNFQENHFNCQKIIHWYTLNMKRNNRGRTFSDQHMYNVTYFHSLNSTTTTTTVLQPFVCNHPGDQGELIPKEYSPTHTYPDCQPSIIRFLHLLQSIASSLFNLCAWQSLHNLSPSPLWSTSWSSFCNTCPCHHNLFCCISKIVSSNPSHEQCVADD